MCFRAYFLGSPGTNLECYWCEGLANLIMNNSLKELESWEWQWCRWCMIHCSHPNTYLHSQLSTFHQSNTVSEQRVELRYKKVIKISIVEEISYPSQSCSRYGKGLPSWKHFARFSSEDRCLQQTSRTLGPGDASGHELPRHQQYLTWKVNMRRESMELHKSGWDLYQGRPRDAN